MLTNIVLCQCQFLFTEYRLIYYIDDNLYAKVWKQKAGVCLLSSKNYQIDKKMTKIEL